MTETLGLTNEEIKKKYLFDVDDFEIFNTGKFGDGLRTKKEIKKGDFFITYFGIEITEEEMDRRLHDPEGSYVKDGVTYLFFIKPGVAVEGDVEENIARKVNHSCEPNSQRYIKRRSKTVKFRALRDIRAGEELTIDYHLRPSAKKVTCLCGTTSCRGTLNFYGK